MRAAIPQSRSSSSFAATAASTATRFSVPIPSARSNRRGEHMTILTPTRDLGAKTVPTTMVQVAGDAVMTPDALSTMLSGTGLNGQFVGDLMSAFLAHEQCGT